MRRNARDVMLTIGILLLLILVGMVVMPTQALPTARITVVGHVVSPLSRPASVSVRSSAGYGLTSSEMRAGWSPLNAAKTVEAPITGAGFTAELPPLRYCVTRWMWQRMPPPPVAFVLRFSDAPEEQYLVSRSRSGLRCVVLGPDGREIRREAATWRIDVMELTPRRGGAPNRWILDVRLEPVAGVARLQTP